MPLPVPPKLNRDLLHPLERRVERPRQATLKWFSQRADPEVGDVVEEPVRVLGNPFWNAANSMPWNVPSPTHRCRR